MILKDGGNFDIPKETKEKWAKIYPNADLTAIISVLDKKGIFASCSKQKALKLINKALKENDNVR